MSSEKLKKLIALDMKYFLDKIYSQQEDKLKHTYPSRKNITLGILPSFNPSKIFLNNSDFEIMQGNIGEVRVSRRIASSIQKRKEASAHLSAVWVGAQLLAKNENLYKLRALSHKKRKKFSKRILRESSLGEWSLKQNKHRGVYKFIEKEEHDLMNLLELAEKEINIGQSTNTDTSLIEKEVFQLKKLISNFDKLKLAEPDVAHKILRKFEKEKIRLLKQLNSEHTSSNVWEELNKKQGIN